MGLIGCGVHGERYLRHLQAGDVPGASARVIWRRDAVQAATLAERYGVETEDSFEALLGRDDVDAWIVATPPGRHRAGLRAAAATGRPILVEKPLTGTWEQARALQSELPPTARIMVAQTLRWNAALLAARERWGALGPVHRVRVAQRLEPSNLAWQRDEAVSGGGSVTLTGVHLFDLARWYLGASPLRVHCQMIALGGHPLENLFDACFEFEDPPCLVACEVSKFSSSRSSWLEAIGSEGQLWVDYAQGRLWSVKGQVRSELPSPGNAPTLPSVLNDFVAYARGETPCPVPLSDGLETMRMIEACYRSVREGRRVDLDEIR